MHLFVVMFSCFISLCCYASNYGDHTDAALRHFRDATKFHRNGQHILNLSALRMLKDEDLRPLFLQFTQHSEWTVQVHAVLGLAELSDEQVVDPWIVKQISPPAREHLIAQALDDGFLKQEQMETLLEWSLLEESPKLLLIADLQLLGVEIDFDMLRELANTTDLSVAMFAALLSKDKNIIDDSTQRLRRASNSERIRSLLRTLQLIRQYQTVDSNKWILSLLENHVMTLTDKERGKLLYTLLTIDTESGLEHWNTAFPQHPDRFNQVEHLLVLLESGITPTPKIIQRLEIDLDDPLLGTMVRAGNVTREPSEITEGDIGSLIELVEQGHRGSIEFAFRAAKIRLSNEQAITFYKSLSMLPEHPNLRRKEVAARAFENLIVVDEDTAWKMLHSVKDDSEQQELLLFATLQIAGETATKAVSSIRRIGVNKADVMTLLLIARGSEPLDVVDQRNLGIIAAGGGHVTSAFETQAAWLYLKSMGLADKALAAVSDNE